MKLNRIFAVLMMLIIVASCGNDDNGIDAIATPPRLLSEVAIENETEIRTYLETHFYNYDEFDNPPLDFDYEIRIDKIEGENATKIPLIDQVVARTIKVSSNEFLIEGEDDIEHKYYFLDARTGIGNKPTIADSTFVRYQGSLLDGTVFDDNQTGIWWDNPAFQFPGLGERRAFRGAGEGVTNFTAGNQIIEFDNGTFEVEGHGVGMIIIPSGLATFNGNRGIIEAYSPLIFKVDVLLAKNETDHDRDGIPSLLEDVDSDGLIVDEDTDEDSIANYQDADDDNDGIPTRDEIELDAEGNFVSFLDTDGDGISDHLDNDN